ncbi:MAG: hypothetical protein MUF42_05955 [Cytophagaceae bacterium]|jgi:hypothetical protein|nr:hypothetical protein [Cytophagaceae bacterium]
MISIRTLGFSLVILFSTFFFQPAKAQNYETASAYMEFINTQYMEIMKDYWAYTSAVGHGKSARKVEDKRKELLTTTSNVTRKISLMPPFKGDKSLRDSATSFLRISYHVLNHDYAKIVNMEEISEQSYDAMEAYLLAQDVANDKIKAANDRLTETQKSFAARNNVNLVEGESNETIKKINAASEVNGYHRVIYLIFFKSYKQEYYLMEAMNKKNINGMEQNKNSLLQFSKEGIAKLDTMKAFKGDKSMIQATKQLLEFYQKECNEKVSILTNFYIEEDNFQKIKKAFDAKKPADRTQADVDQFNQAVNKLNKAVAEFNTTNQQLNENRKKLIDQWNKTSDAFLDKFTPKN